MQCTLVIGTRYTNVHDAPRSTKALTWNNLWWGNSDGHATHAQIVPLATAHSVASSANSAFTHNLI
jgi:hypothetical protein